MQRILLIVLARTKRDVLLELSISSTHVCGMSEKKLNLADLLSV
jgi:hypothetical protein